MPSEISSIIQNINLEHNKKLNILCSTFHEGFQSQLSKTGHNFFILKHPVFKEWDGVLREFPKNFSIINMNGESISIKSDIVFDLILCGDRANAYTLLAQVSKHFNCPMINVDIKLPHIDLNKFAVSNLINVKSNHNVFTSEYCCNIWGLNTSSQFVDIIPIGIDTELFSGWSGSKNYILMVANNVKNRSKEKGFDFAQVATNGLPTMLLGRNDFHGCKTVNINDLVLAYQNTKVFINTSSWSDCPMSVLEAMSVGCPVITTPCGSIQSFIENGFNGYIVNTPEEMNEKIKELMNNQEKSAEIGKNARQTILSRFNQDMFVENWNKMFYNIVKNTGYCVV